MQATTYFGEITMVETWSKTLDQKRILSIKHMQYQTQFLFLFFEYTYHKSLCLRAEDLINT